MDCSSTDSHSILVVDDGTVRGEILRPLRDAGYTVTAVETFHEAIVHIETHAPNALITELRLGAYNGLHIIIRSSASNPEMVAIIHTAFPDTVLESEARRLGADYLVQPVDPWCLLAILSDRLTCPYDRQRISPDHPQQT